jgi:hypothetical protein
VLSCRPSLPLSRQTLNFAAGIIRRHRIPAGSLWRKLNPGQQALLVLACLRKGETFASPAAGFGVGTATAWRYVEETVALLAARAPEAAQGGPGRGEGQARLRRPGRDADPHRPGRRGPALLLRQAQQARHEPAGHRQPPRRHPLGLRSAARLGPRQEGRLDLGASWPNWRTPRWSPSPARATRGARTRRSPTKGKNKPDSQKQANKAHAKLRAPGERANAQLKTWKILTKLRCRPWRAGQLARAIHVLRLRET